MTRLEDAHWLAKATSGETFVDLIFGMGNGVALIDGDWTSLQPSGHARRDSRAHRARPKNCSGTGCSSASGIATTSPTSCI